LLHTSKLILYAAKSLISTMQYNAYISSYYVTSKYVKSNSNIKPYAIQHDNIREKPAPIGVRAFA